MKIDYNQVKNLAINGDIDTALKELAIETFGTDDEMEATMLRARHRQLTKDVSMGIMDKDDILRERNQIMVAFLNLMNRLEEKFLTTEVICDYIKLYETAVDAPEPDDFEAITHKNVFKLADTRSIAWVISLSYPVMPATFEFAFDWVMLWNQRPIFPKQIQSGIFEKDWFSSYLMSSYGSNEPGAFDIGEYQIDIYYRDKKISSAQFSIVA